MLKIYKIIVFLVCTSLLPVFVSGCGDSKDINEKSILTAVAMDKKGDDIFIYVEIANIQRDNNRDSGSGGTGSKYIYVKSHGKTIPEARENLDRQLDKEAYLSAIRKLILTESFAKEHLVEYLYRVRAEELYRKKIITIITKEDPAELFKISNEKGTSVGFSIEDMLKNLVKIGESFLPTTPQLIEKLSSSYTGFLLPNIGLKDQESSLIGYSVVNGTTIVGFICVENSKGTVFLKAGKPKFTYVVPYEDNKFTIEVRLKKRKIKPFYINNMVNFDIKFDFEAKLMYGDKKTPYNFNNASKAEVTKALTGMLKDELTEAVELAQNHFKCDYFQFDDEFRIKFPVEFQNMDWQDEFTKASFNIDVKLVLSGTWMMDYENTIRN